MTKWKMAGDYSVEIWFRIEKDQHGYPTSRDWEQLLAKPSLKKNDYFEVESVPFYLKNVSCGDLVKAKIVKNSSIQIGEVFEFDSVVERGGHNTYRLLLRRKHVDDPEFTTNELVRKGLAVEQQDQDFFAVDVPPSVDQLAIDKYLVTESEYGRWEIQDGYLHSIKTQATD